jgi:environmental stress-induced protein Ves
LRLVPRASLVAMPWKNGGGVTRQIACFPPDSDIGSFAWRISTAEVTADGAFSRFDGIDRRLYILDGAGLALRMGAKTRRVLTGEHIDFPGEEEVHGALIDGPVADLNIMVRRERQRMHVEPVTVDGGRVLDMPWPAAAVFVMSGALQASGFTARRHDTLVSDDGDAALTVEGRAEVLLIGFEPARRSG